MGIYTFDIKTVYFKYGGSLITGFAEGSVIRIEMKNDLFSLLVGADGLGGRAKSNDESARITTILMPNSPGNLIFHGALMLDRAKSAGALPLSIDDAATGDQFAALGAWVVKDPGRDMQKTIQGVEWILETDRLVVARTRPSPSGLII